MTRSLNLARRITTALTVCAIALATSSISHAEGLLYALSEDGSWVSFEMVGTATDPESKDPDKIEGTITMSSVGVEIIDGQRCRWIEIAGESTLNGKEFISADKLLIPEEHLAKGKDPIKHVLRLWTKHSQIDGGQPFQTEDLSGKAAQIRLQSLTVFLHGPFLGRIDKLSPEVIETKLGKLACKGVRSNEDLMYRDGRSKQWSYSIRLHEQAPFGVVAWDGKVIVQSPGQQPVTQTQSLKLKDFGKNAKSLIPN